MPSFDFPLSWGCKYMRIPADTGVQPPGLVAPGHTEAMNVQHSIRTCSQSLQAHLFLSR
jgi:hypothetical protein